MNGTKKDIIEVSGYAYTKERDKFKDVIKPNKESKEIVKNYNFPEHCKQPKIFENSTKVEYYMQIAFEEITDSFTKQNDKAILNWIYKKYKDTDVSNVYVLSKEDFKNFLLEMLPKWRAKQ